MGRFDNLLLLCAAPALLGACGARSSLAIGGGGGSASSGPSASSSTSGSGGSMQSRCEPRQTWIARAGTTEDLESVDALTTLDDCSVLASGDVVDGLFLHRYDGAGDLVFAAQYGDGDSELARGIDVDDAGNIYLGAEIWGSIDFGGGPLTSVQNWDMVLASFEADGTHRWSRLLGGPDYQETSDLAVDAPGNTVIAGEVAGPIDFGGGTLTPAGSWDIALASFDTDGNHRWSRLFGDDDIQLAPRIDVLDDGTIWWAGWFAGTLPLDGQVLLSTSYDDSYLVRLSPAGSVEMAMQISGNGSQRALDVAAAPDGGAVVVGEFNDELVLTFNGYFAIGDRDAFVVRYDATGLEQWARVFGGPNNTDASATAVAVGPDGRVFVTGAFEGELQVDGELYPSVGLRDMFVAELAPDGELVRFSIYGDETTQYPMAIGAFPDGSYAFGGAFEGTLVIGEGVDAMTAGGTDGFVSRVLQK